VERLLIRGVDTTVGANLALALSDRFEVLALYHHQAIELSCARTQPADAADPAQLQDMARAWQPDWIIDCGPLCAASWDVHPGEAAGEHESRITAALAELTSTSATRLTVISSDAVFAGPRMFHEEDSPFNEASAWAQRVVARERELVRTSALVVRTCAYGWSPADVGPCFAERAMGWLDSGTVGEADGLRHATPILATDLAALLVRAYELRLHGLYHLAGAERTSLHRFVRELAAVSGQRMPVGSGMGQHEGGTGAPLETSLNSKRARRALEMATPLLRDGLIRFVEQAADGWCDRWRTSVSTLAA
jgi:dTDP-4-dehydrorhamnose reductase